ncbi:MAG: hypothetical protein AB7S26_36550 [Sandaracinaceae bacterium]
MTYRTRSTPPPLPSSIPSSIPPATSTSSGIGRVSFDPERSLERRRLDALARQVDHLDDLFVGCLANDVGHADKLGALSGELSSVRDEVARLERLTKALVGVVHNLTQENRRLRAESEVLATRQEGILRQLTAMSRTAPASSLGDATEELGPGEWQALYGFAL